MKTENSDSVCAHGSHLLKDDNKIVFLSLVSKYRLSTSVKTFESATYRRNSVTSSNLSEFHEVGFLHLAENCVKPKDRPKNS
jgi:hypothetical protein